MHDPVDGFVCPQVDTNKGVRHIFGWELSGRRRRPRRFPLGLYDLSQVLALLQVIKGFRCLALNEWFKCLKDVPELVAVSPSSFIPVKRNHMLGLT